jgi:serine/threonine protein phosphatase 1
MRGACEDHSRVVVPLRGLVSQSSDSSLNEKRLGCVWKSDSVHLGLSQAKIPEGVRVYAVGDVHGRADLLEQIFAGIDADLTARPADVTIEIFLGDYIDRGPASSGVLDHLIERRHSHPTFCLKGNHEAYMMEFLQDPAILDEWSRYGGLETLLSYGLTPSLNLDPDEKARLANALARALPDKHRHFLSSLRTTFTCGDFYFVHAGVRPGVPLEQQTEEDLLWIREDFLIHEEQFAKVIVHGHTPVPDSDIRPNRINIDTGAFATGRLTCLVLEGQNLAVIQTGQILDGSTS